MSRLTVLVAAAFLAAPVPIGASNLRRAPQPGNHAAARLGTMTRGNPRLGLLGLLSAWRDVGPVSPSRHHFDARRDK